MRTHPHLVHPRQQTYISSNQQQSHVKQQYSMQDSYAKPHKRSIGGPCLTQQRSFSSSEEELRSTPEFEGKSYTINTKQTNKHYFHYEKTKDRKQLICLQFNKRMEFVQFKNNNLYSFFQK